MFTLSQVFNYFPPTCVLDFPDKQIEAGLTPTFTVVLFPHCSGVFCFHPGTISLLPASCQPPHLATLHIKFVLALPLNFPILEAKVLADTLFAPQA